MSIKKRIFALICSLTMILSFSACADTTWASKIEDTEISAGIFIYYTIQGYNSAYSILSAEDGFSEDAMFSQKIEEKDVSTYIEEFATNMCKQHVAISKTFEELGLTLSDSDNKAITNTLDSQWETNQEYYEKQGISEDSVKKIVIAAYKKNMIFDKYYAKGGLEEVSQDDINTEITKSYSRIKILPYYLMDETGVALEDSKKQELMDEANATIAKINDGANFDDLIDAYNAEQNSTDSTSATEEDEKDEFRNEMIVYDGYYYLSTDVVSKILALTDYNKPVLLEDDTAYYVIEKLDILERSDVVDQLTDTVLNTVKDAEFEKMVESWYADYSIEKNVDAYSRYSPQNVAKKMP